MDQTGYSYFLENALKYGWAVPQGVIMMWSGSIATIPTGYVLCNGAQSTPDLRDKFVVGARQDDGGVAKTNLEGSLLQSGGAADHAHQFTGDGHEHDVDSGDAIESGAGFAETTTTDPSDGYTDDQDSFPVPYFALAYIMKT